MPSRANAVTAAITVGSRRMRRWPSSCVIAELRVRPRGGEPAALRERDFAIVVIVDDEQGRVAAGREAIDRERIEVEAGVRGEALLERDPIGVIEAEVLRELHDGVVDDRVRRDEDRSAARRGRRARARAAPPRRRTSAR